jgi:hypothetical protein
MSNRSGITTIRSFPGANAEDLWYTYIFFHTITQHHPEGCGTQFLSIVKVPVRHALSAFISTLISMKATRIDGGQYNRYISFAHVNPDKNGCEIHEKV